MTPFDMGRISAFLVKHRKIEDSSNKKGLQREEKDFAAILRESSIENMRDLEELMSGQGFSLITLSSFDVPGIGQGARVYLLARRADSHCPLLNTGRLTERMSLATGNITVAKIWFTQIWLIHLDLLYTQRDRGPHERHKWLDASFTRDMLEQSVREHINGFIRRLNPTELVSSEVYEVLTSEKGFDITRYTKRFLDLMCEGGMLDERGNGVYRQSLLSAVEIKENFDRTLAPLMVMSSDLSTQAPIATLGHKLMTRTDDNEIQGDEL